MISNNKQEAVEIETVSSGIFKVNNINPSDHFKVLLFWGGLLRVDEL